jgi:phosphatidylinositol alpha-1,6-mannosyltransferase
MKKTLLITLDYLPARGGITQYWVGLKTFLPIDYFFILAPENKQQIFEKNVIRRCFYNNFIWPRWLLLLFYILLLVKKENFKQFIAGQILPIGTILFLLKKIRYIKSYIISLHGFDIYSLTGRKKILAQYILKKADKIIVNSEFTKQVIQQFDIPLEKIVKITPCPQIGVYPKNVQKSSRNEKIILSVSRLVERKGIDTIIRSLPYVWDIDQTIKYIIVGDGPDKNRLQSIVKNEIVSELQKNVIFTGEIKTADLNNYYQKADIFILLPRDIQGDIEGFGMVYLEAGLYKLPVIATNSGGVSEAVKANETGILLPPNPDFKKVATAITLLIKDKQMRDAYGLANFNYAKSFQWQKQAEILIHNL